MKVLYGGIASAWRRRTYRRLEEATPNPRRRKPATRSAKIKRGKGEVGNGYATKRRVLVRPVLRLRLKALISPLRWLRDVYVNAMLALAGGKAGRMVSSYRVSRAPRGLWEGGRVRKTSGRFGDSEGRMVMVLYNVLVANPELREKVHALIDTAT